VVSVEDYKHRGPGFDSRALLRIFLRELGLEWGPLSLVIGDKLSSYLNKEVTVRFGKLKNAAVGFDVLTTCQPCTVWCSRERLPVAAAQPAKVRQSCSATDSFHVFSTIFLEELLDYH
jgi:hypothetical protein